MFSSRLTRIALAGAVLAAGVWLLTRPVHVDVAPVEEEPLEQAEAANSPVTDLQSAFLQVGRPGYGLRPFS
jgi:hypothetical protein